MADAHALDQAADDLSSLFRAQPALGRHPKANVRREGEEQLPAILHGKAIHPFISAEVREKSQPVTFVLPTGGRASGYNAELLPAVCDVYLAARAADVLPKNQEHVAKQAEVLIRGLARVGIIALVDEATGYQEYRKADALAKILEAYIAKELQPWVHTFPNEFYREMFRLRQLEFPKDSISRPPYFGHLTNDVVYSRLAPGVLKGLKAKTPRGASGRHKEQLHRRLSTDLGHPKLREHLAAVVAVMKLSDSWKDFKLKLDRTHPQYGQDVLPIDFGEDTGHGF